VDRKRIENETTSQGEQSPAALTKAKTKRRPSFSLLYFLLGQVKEDYHANDKCRISRPGLFFSC
jgi:hypothetical protein